MFVKAIKAVLLQYLLPSVQPYAAAPPAILLTAAPMRAGSETGNKNHIAWYTSGFT